ncbi:hypothetical protein FQR65_LT12153 [Abscondita terminalis]|nr:hypothetical protein FQR65_LT12153 [Abscondita terminalis]
MKKVSKTKINIKLIAISILSFLLGAILVTNLFPINKTCQLDNTDKEYNIMQNSKLKNPELIILIMSALQNLDKRNAVRETWLSLRTTTTKPFKHYFVIGSVGLSPDQILHLSSEQSLHNDMLILPMIDSYKNLTLKVSNSFVWLKEQLDVGLDFKYVLKCDDDSFVRIDNLLLEIEHIEIMYLKANFNEANLIDNNNSPYLRVNIQHDDKSISPSLQLYWGYFHGKAHIQTNGKWKESNWILCDYYLPYALGGGYILSKNLIIFIASNANYLRHYTSEDVSVGAWLATIKDVLRIHDARFDTEWTSRGCQNYHLISHHLSITQMHTVYNNILSTGTMCGNEFSKRSYYLYDWGAPPIITMKSDDNQKNSHSPKKKDNKNDKIDENKVINKQDIIKMLIEANIDCYEPQVVDHLTDYMNNYMVEILNSANAYKTHAGRNNIDISDVKLAIDTYSKKTPAKRLPRKELIQLAQEQNKEKLEDCNGVGLLLPKNDYTLSKSNYKLRNLHSQTVIPQPTMGISNRHNHMVNLNSLKNQTSSIPTYIRTSVGTVSLNVPINLAPQRIILKQPQFTTFNKVDENSNKRLKLDGLRK